MIATQVVANTGRWPANTVFYSQVGTASPTGHRPDCSGFASMCLGLPAPGENTVTLLTKGIVRPIGWAGLAAGDVVGALGEGTAGDVGHVMVVVAVHAPTYDVMEQGGGYGPDRNTYRIGDPQGRGFAPYRLSTLEDDDMAADPETILWLTTGAAADGSGYLNPAKVPDGPQRWAAVQAAAHNIAAVQAAIAALSAKVDKLGAGAAQVDAAALAKALLAEPGFAKALADAAFQGAQRAESE